MNKENQAISNAEVPMIRVTRARAAAYDAAKQLLEQKQNSRPNLKRPALEEKKNAASATTAPPRKKRVVLKDVANVCCESLCMNGNTATKTQVDILQCLLSSI